LESYLSKHEQYGHVAWTISVSLISSDPTSKDAMPDSQRYLKKALSDQA